MSIILSIQIILEYIEYIEYILYDEKACTKGFVWPIICVYEYYG